MFTANAINDVEYFKETMVYYNGKNVKIEDTKMKLYGKLAERLGLEEVNFKQLENLANGKSANGKIDLIQGAGEPRKIAYDNTISLGKDLSIAYSMADEKGKKEILESFEASIHETMKYKEDNFSISKLKDSLGERKQGAEIAYTIIYHWEDRDGMPQVHAHILELNLISDSEGNISSQDNQKTFKNQKVLGAMFRNTFVKNMMDKGYSFERHPLKPEFLKLKGISIELMETMSRRKKAILEYIEKKYGNAELSNLTTKEKKEAVLATRNSKNHLKPTQLFESWKNFYSELKLDTHKIFDDLKLQTPTNFNEIKLDTSSILKKLTEKNATFSIEEMTSEYINAYCGTKSNAEILEIIKQELANNKEIIKVEDCCLKKPTDKMVEILEVYKENGYIEDYSKINKDSFEDVRKALNKCAERFALKKETIRKPTNKMLEALESLNLKNYDKIDKNSFAQVRKALNKDYSYEMDEYKDRSYKKNDFNLQKLQDFTQREPEYRYTTLSTVMNELSTIESCVGYKKDTLKLGFENIKEEIEKINQTFKEQTKNKDASLSNEQLNMIYQCAYTNNGVSIINGAPGSGKSSGCLVVVKAHEKEGYEVIGTALSSKATDGLGKSAEIKKTFNLHNLCTELESGKLVFNQKSLLVIDEAGQLDSNTTATIMKHIKKAEAEGKEIKVVMLGDYKQLPSVNASNPFMMLREKLGCVELNEINRQRARTLEDGTVQDGRLFYTDEMGYKHNVVHLLGNGENLKALQVYKDNDKLHMFDSKAEKLDFIAKTFTEFKEPMTEKAVVVATNNEMDVVNNSIRRELIKNGVIDSKEYSVLSKWVADDGNVDFKEYKFSLNDRIVFKKNNKEKEIKNGNLATITKIEKLKNGTVIINAITDDGQSVRLDTSKENECQIKSGYAMTAHISQGLTINQTITSFSDSLHTSGSHVAGSRHRYNNIIALSKADIHDFERRTNETVLGKDDDLLKAIEKMDKILKNERIKENAIQYKLENLAPELNERLKKITEHKPESIVINHNIQELLEQQKNQEMQNEIELKKSMEWMKETLKQSNQEEQKPTETKEVQTVETKTIKKTKKQENGLSL